MQGYGLRFHHLGLAVPGPEHAFRFLAALGYRIGGQTFDPLQNVNLAMRHHTSMPDVEVIWPGEGPSPIDQMIKRGNMIYHMCFETDDAAASLAAIEADGLRVFSLGEPKPARLFGGVPVSFHRVDQVGLIELIHGVAKPVLI
ncbi:MAG: VOC family protein [Acetobacteraceae bacterium]|nr:VOC family protein [Acetobacteraceae bacterium]